MIILITGQIIPYERKTFKNYSYFCKDIYFSKLYILKNVRFAPSDKKIMRNEDLEKPTKFRPSDFPNPNFICFFIKQKPDDLFFLSG